MSRRWIVFGVTGSLIAFMQLDLLTIGAFLPEVAHDLDINSRQLGFLVAGFALVFALVQLPAGLLFSRGHQRAVLTLAAMVVGAGNLLFALADSFWIAAASRILSGAAGAFFFVGFTSLMGRLFAPLEFGRILGGNQMLKFFVATATLLALPSILDVLGWRGYLVGIAMLFGILALSVWAWVPNLAAMQEGSERPLGRQLRTVAREPNLRWCAIATALGNGALTAFLGTWCEPFLIAAGFSEEYAAWLGGAAVIGLGSGIFFYGWVSDRLKRRKLPLVLSGLLGSLALAGVISAPVQNPLVLAIMLFFAAALASAPLVLTFAIAKESVAGEDSSVGISMTNIGAYLFIALFQLLPAFSLGTNLSQTPLATYQVTLSMIPLSLLFAGLAALPIRETGGRQA